MTDCPTEDKIRQRALQIWEARGYPIGDELWDWTAAKASLRDDMLVFPLSTSCVQLKLRYPCADCVCRAGAAKDGWSITGNGCWIMQNIWHLPSYLQEGRLIERLTHNLITDGINATKSERYLYMRKAIELAFPKHLPLVDGLATKFGISLPTDIFDQTLPGHFIWGEVKEYDLPDIRGLNI